MKTCKKCREAIQDKASICPYCRSAQPDIADGCAKLFGAAFVIALFAAGLSTCKDSKSVTPTEEDKAQYLAAHGGDPKALDDRFGMQAQGACSASADDYLRSIARNDFAWDDDTKGLFGVRFDKISVRSAGPGLLTLISTRAKLSNGFGAFQHVDIFCLYDARSDKVVRFAQDDPANDALSEANQDSATTPYDDETPTAADAAPDANDARPSIAKPSPDREDDPQPENRADPGRYPADPD